VKRFSASRVASVAAIGLLCGSTVSAQPTQYEIRLVLPTATLPFTAPLGMSAAGVIVGYGGPEAFSPFSVPITVDPTGALTVLGSDEPNFGFAHGINDAAGAIVGEYAMRPQIWTGGRRLELQVPAGYFSGVARDIVESGLIVGSFADYDDVFPPNPIGPRPCFWPDASAPAVPMRGLLPRVSTGLAFAVNGRGQVAGTVASREGFVAVRWNSPRTRPVNLGHLPGAILSEARGINEAGDVAGRSGFADGSGRAFIGRAGTRSLEALPSLPADFEYAEAFDLDDLGNVVGLSRVREGVVHAVLWTNGEAIDLNERLVAPDPLVRHLSAAIAINHRGVIAAEAVLESSTGDHARAIAILVPVAAPGAR
jgi:probable HAF family extracellular repeat protein